MKHLTLIANALNLRIHKTTDCGYSGYRVINNRTGMSVGMFFDSLDSVAEFLAAKIKKESVSWLAANRVK